MMKTLTAASVLAIAGAASAAPFSIFGYAAGGGLVPGVAGAGFQTSGLGFFHAESTPDITSDLVGNLNDANFREFDSYFGLNSFGPTARGTTTAANRSDLTRNFYGDYPATSAIPPFGNFQSTPASGLIVAPGSFIGDVSFVTPALEKNAGAGIGFSPVGSVSSQASGFAPNKIGGGRSQDDGIFIARLTTNAGAILSGGANVRFNVGGNLVAVDVSIGSFATVQGLPDSFTINAVKVGTVDIQVGSLAGGNGDAENFIFGSADVYDLWLVNKVPTPGALALFGLGGIAALRRRRSA